MDIGQRLRALRWARGMTLKATGFPIASLLRFEIGQQVPMPEKLAEFCGVYGVGLQRFFCDWDQFQAMLALEDDFVLEVVSFLKQLNDEQKKLILQTLEAAPKTPQPHRGRRSSANTESQTSTESENYTASKVSAMPFRTSPIQSLRWGVLQKTKVEYRKSQHF